MKIKISKLSFYLAIVILCSVAFSPSIRIGRVGLTVDDIIVPIFGLFLFFNRKTINQNDRRLIKYFSYYFVILLFSTIYGFLSFYIQPRINDLFELARLLKYVFIIIIVQQSQERFSIEKFEKWMVIGAFILIFISFFEFYNYLNFRFLFYQIFNLNIEKYYSSAEYRIVGSAGNPNEFSSILVIYFLFILQKMLDDHKRNILYFLCLVLLMYSVILTGSRTGLIALIAGASFLIFVSKRTSRLTKTLLFSLFLVISSATISSLTYFKESIALFFSGESTSMNARYLIWDNVLTHISNSPVFGYGTSKDFIMQNQLLSDNEFLMIILKTGFVGLFVFMFNYLKAIIKLNKSTMYANRDYIKNFINSIFLISFVFMFTSAWYYAYKPFIFFILLYSIALKHYTTKDIPLKTLS